MSNAYRRLTELLPQPSLLIGTVLAVHEGNTTTVEYPDGSQQRVRGAQVGVGEPAFVRAGVIEGRAPARVAFVIEI